MPEPVIGESAPPHIQEYAAWKARHGYGVGEDAQEDSEGEFGEGSGESEAETGSFEESSSEESDAASVAGPCDASLVDGVTSEDLGADESCPQ